MSIFSKKTDPLTDEDIDYHLIVLAAFRYSLGRNSYMVQEMIAWIQDKWRKLPKKTRDLIMREIEVALEVGSIADECDALDWEEFLEFAYNQERII